MYNKIHQINRSTTRKYPAKFQAQFISTSHNNTIMSHPLILTKQFNNNLIAYSRFPQLNYIFINCKKNNHIKKKHNYNK